LKGFRNFKETIAVEVVRGSNDRYGIVNHV
jgi:hypothetical protein